MTLPSAYDPYDLGVILPTQHGDTRQPTPQQQLALAVLENGIISYFRTQRVASIRANRLHEEDRCWIFSDDDRWPFSFLNCCAAAGVEPSSVRGWIARRQFDTARMSRVRKGRLAQVTREV